MMYSNRFIASIRVGGKILRENQGTVTLPFGSEYELLLKNVNSRRAMVSVSVDGQDITGGTRLIISPNDTIVLERFIKNGNLSSGNRLKFVERTSGIEFHRGIKQDDGLIRVEFWAEKEKPMEIQETIVRRHYRDEWYPHHWCNTLGNTLYKSINCNVGEEERGGFIYGYPQGSGSTPGQTVIRSSCAQNIQVNSLNTAFNDAGITVPGSVSNQQFYSVSGFPLEAFSTVIVLQLRGEAGGVAVVKPITVDIKPKCSSCGKMNKANSKFCSECGTALVLI